MLIHWTSVQGNARLAEASLAEEIAAALDATDKDVLIETRTFGSRVIYERYRRARAESD
jgi:hypothetical protein